MSTVIPRQSGYVQTNPETVKATPEELYANKQFRLYSGLKWLNISVILAMHLMALTALFTFQWDSLLVMVVLYTWAGMGITLGYHRMLTHRGLILHPIARFVIHLGACLSMQGPPLKWALTHRIHHACSDQPGDPHSPIDGVFWSHMLWLGAGRDTTIEASLQRKYIPDLANDPLCLFFTRTYLLWNILLGLILLWLGGISWLAWGMFLRVVLGFHMTWLVNSATHIWGYRNYETPDRSRNLWWVALFTFGEGWHNNHHAQPTSAYHGHRWWEIDLTGWMVTALCTTGLAHRVIGPKVFKRERLKY